MAKHLGFATFGIREVCACRAELQLADPAAGKVYEALPLLHGWRFGKARVLGWMETYAGVMHLADGQSGNKV